MHPQDVGTPERGGRRLESLADPVLFGAQVGDSLLAASIELRLPLSSPLATGKTGFLLFYDTAAAWNAGRGCR